MSDDRPARQGWPSASARRTRSGASGGSSSGASDDEPFDIKSDIKSDTRSGTPSEKKSGSGFGPSFRKKSTPAADPGGFSRSSEQKPRTRSRAASAPEPVVVDGFTRSSQQPTLKKTVRPDGPSLKMRAADYLSRREHSRFELARKLGRWSDNREEIEAVLDAMVREGWMSTARFVQSVVHRRAPKQGTSRIVQELRQHGIDQTEIEAVKPDLQASEFVRAQTVWHKRFGAVAPDREGWAKQARFLAARGFSQDVIRRVLGGEDDPA